MATEVYDKANRDQLERSRAAQLERESYVVKANAEPVFDPTDGLDWEYVTGPHGYMVAKLKSDEGGRACRQHPVPYPGCPTCHGAVSL